MKIAKLLIVCCLSLFIATATSAQEYIGAIKCKMCHNKTSSGFQYNIWKENKHSKALESLNSEESWEYAKQNNIADPTKEPSCLKCHSTYHSVDQDLILTLKPDEGVSCETCHGPGSKYKSNTIMKSREKSLANGLIIPDQKLCETCHNKENPFYKPFDYEAALAKIAHPKPAE
jgi:hypothetical protein